MPQPLDGVRVIEMANFISGPYAGMLLGDLGAEVIKVEQPGSGDPFRKWGGHRGQARPQFLAYNRGKQSVALDIQSDAGREAYRRLASTADVIVENFRPGTVERLGIGYEDLRPDNPRLVYCSISGMGHDGPYSHRPSYENVGLALSGLWSRLVDMRAPRPIGPNIVDQLTSLYAVAAILGGLVEAGRTGSGRRLYVNMLASAMGFMPEPIANYLVLGEVGDLDTRARRSQAYAFVCRDGRPLAIHLSSVPKFWEGLLRAIERPELLNDDRFATLRGRIDHYDDLRATLEAAFRTRDREEWLTRLDREDVPSAPINTIAEALDDPQVRHLGLVREYGQGESATSLIRSPVDFRPDDDLGTSGAPDLGQHTQEVLRGIGLSEDEIATLEAGGGS